MSKPYPLGLRAVTLALLGFTAFLTVASATHSWGGYHWARTSNPFTLKLVDSVTPQWQASLVQASSDWNVSTVLDTAIEQGNESNGARYVCQTSSGKVHVCNYSYGNT